MKRAIFAILVVLLAMLAVTCDSAVLPAKLSAGPGQVAPPPVEPDWVTINIGIADSNDRARAMTRALNSGSVDYYEVVFHYAGSPAITVRATKDATTVGVAPTGWVVTVPAVDYTAGGATTAVLYAGKKATAPNPNILIAIGTITGSGDLKTNTSITFTLTAISNSNPFSITPSTTGTETDPDGLTGGATVTSHKVQEGSGSLAATYTFTLPANANAVVSAAGTVTPATVTAPSPGLTPSGSVLAVTVPTPNTAGTSLGTSAVFSFNVTPGTSPGYGKIYIAVPINAHSTNPGRNPTTSVADVTPITWSLQGGLDNATLDTGTNTGGAVLLQVLSGPTVTADITSGTPKGWNGNVVPITHPYKTWTVSIDAPLSDNIALTADPTNFDSAPTFQWKLSTSGTPASGDNPVSTTISGVTDTAATLTIPYTNAYLATLPEKTFYVYCDATLASPAQNATSNVIRIVVQSAPVETEVEIVIANGFF